MNIYDVARMAGVSISTASKALNDRKDVSPATRERVIEIARQMDYHPSHLARGLAQRRTENLGVVALRRFDSPLFTNPFYSQIIEGLETQATEINYNLLLSVIRTDEGDPEIGMPKMLKERSVDGLVLMGEMPEKFVRNVVERNLPMVVIDKYVDGLETEYVLSDNRSGARDAVRYMISRGHKKIGIISGSLDEHSFAERRAGFMEGLDQAGLKPVLEFIHDDPWVDWDEWLPKMMAQPDRPTALFCCNDDHALKLMTAAARLEISVPGDLSLAGCDDIAEAEAAGLTTVRVEKSAMGRRSVERLMQIIQEPSLPRQINRFPTHLVERKSVGKVG